MRLLLDTNAFLWWMAGDARLGAKARTQMTAAAIDVLLSSVVIWEIAIKRALGRLDLDMSTADLVAGAVEVQRFRPLAFDSGHAVRVEGLPFHHNDPFDRALIAQALEADAQIVTADRLLARYDVAIVDARK
jgi:PIN domain nuclease of toxin-antitoxin system